MIEKYAKIKDDLNFLWQNRVVQHIQKLFKDGKTVKDFPTLKNQFIQLYDIYFSEVGTR